MNARNDTLLRVEDLCVVFGSAGAPVRAVDGISFCIAPGETLALVGESGSGKSVTALSLARLLPAWQARVMGGITFDGVDVLSLDDHALRRFRGKSIAYVFQEPSAALNPVFTIGYQIVESLRAHGRDRSSVASAYPALRGSGAVQESSLPDRGGRVSERYSCRREAIEWLGRVGIPDPERCYRSYPHQLSGGMQQRAVIAMALACRPRLLVADEPTTALDVTVQAQILKLLASLQRELQMSMLLITHNLAIVAGIADRICVMKSGKLVETGPTEAVLRSPQHPYTQALLSAVPRLNVEMAGQS